MYFQIEIECEAQRLQRHQQQKSMQSNPFHRQNETEKDSEEKLIVRIGQKGNSRGI